MSTCWTLPAVVKHPFTTGYPMSVNDELYDRAVLLVRGQQKLASATSFLQRKLNLGYAPALRLAERLEAEGVIGSVGSAGGIFRAVLAPAGLENPMSNPETHSCCTCGFTWNHGEDGSHHCPTHLRAIITEFRAALHAEFSPVTPRCDAPCQASLMRGGNRCECSGCRRSRYRELEARAEALGITR